MWRRNVTDLASRQKAFLQAMRVILLAASEVAFARRGLVVIRSRSIAAE